MAEDDRTVIVYETDNQGIVAVIKMALTGADIPFTAVNEVVSTIYPVDGMAVVSFEVLERDAPRARQTLTRLGLA